MSRTYKKQVLFSNDYKDYVTDIRYKTKTNHEHTPSYWKNYFTRQLRQNNKEYINKLIKDMENEDRLVTPRTGKGDVNYKIW